MDVWKDKVAIVTGAGEGIGAQIVIDLVKVGMRVIGFEPTVDKVHQMLDNLRSSGKVKGQLIPCKCDISNDEDLKKAFDGVVKLYGGVDLLVNNAAIGRGGLISTGEIQDMHEVINVNIYGLVACTRLAIESMKNKGGKGQIINVNSICGHYMPTFAEPKTNMYVASKRAMTAFNKILQKEFQEVQHNIKVVSISPGIVKTNLFKNSSLTFIDDEFFETNPHLSVEDVSNTILMILSTPSCVHIKEIIFHALHEVY